MSAIIRHEATRPSAGDNYEFPVMDSRGSPAPKSLDNAITPPLLSDAHYSLLRPNIHQAKDFR